jgi:hypothetical protein
MGKLSKQEIEDMMDDDFDPRHNRKPKVRKMKKQDEN